LGPFSYVVADFTTVRAYGITGLLDPSASGASGEPFSCPCDQMGQPANYAERKDDEYRCPCCCVSMPSVSDHPDKSECVDHEDQQQRATDDCLKAVDVGRLLSLHRQERR
jgi:hypothetical protein